MKRVNNNSTVDVVIVKAMLFAHLITFLVPRQQLQFLSHGADNEKWIPISTPPPVMDVTSSTLCLTTQSHSAIIQCTTALVIYNAFFDEYQWCFTKPTRIRHQWDPKKLKHRDGSHRPNLKTIKKFFCPVLLDNESVCKWVSKWLKNNSSNERCF